jgi:Amt family ammonium transporter
MFAEWLKTGKPTVLGAISGAVAGLVVITPASGFVAPMSALIMGAVGGVVCFFAATVVKAMFGYDDSLDAFGVHGVGGTLGAILTGVFATSAINSAIKTADFDYNGGGAQLGRQLIATLITWVIAVVGSLIFLKLVDLVIGLRVSESDEYDGLDLTQHGESGYNFEEVFPGSVSTDVAAQRREHGAAVETKVSHA